MSKPTYEELARRLKEIEDEKAVRQKIEDALRESEEKYKTLTENIAIGIFRSTPGPTGRFIEVNPAYASMLGYENKLELMAQDVSQIYQNPGERAGFSEKLSQKGFLKSEELILRKKDGTAVVVSETAMAVKDENGEILYFHGIVEDITERKKAEQELHIQKIYLERLFNSAPEAIVLHDNDDVIVDVNEEFTKMFGFSREEAIGKPLNELVASEEYLEHASTLSYKVIHGERVEEESKRKCKDGTLIDVSILGAPIFHDGVQMAVYAIYRNITERKKAEEALRIQKTYLEELFNSAPEGIVLHDTNDIIVNVNNEFTRMFGYTREEAIGKPINDLVASEEYKDHAATNSSMVLSGQRTDNDSKRKRKDGTLFDVWILGAPIFYGVKQMGVYAIYRDITERKRAEEARIRLGEEARMARNIQMNLLPKSNPNVPGYDIAGKSIPALNVGGDYYDFIRLDDHRLAIGLGDVSGKGLPASLVMTNLQATIRGQAFFDTNAKQCLERANTLLFRSTDSRTFVSLFYGILDTQKNTLCYANAGQNLPLAFSAGKKPFRLKSRGIALGVQENVFYDREEISIQPEERLLIYSDGISEAMNDRLEEFGDDRLLEVVQRNLNDSARELIEKIIAAIHQHVGGAPQNDDITLVILERKK